jgi:starch-binding outer membrane protein, SusD/RagB family
MPANRGVKIDFFYLTSCCLCLFLPSISCNKIVAVPNPISSVTANQVFSSDATATSAMLGLYSYMSYNNNQASFSNLQTTTYLALSADELTDVPSGYERYDNFLSNDLTVQLDGYAVQSAFWQPAYFDIYSANAIISGIQASTGITSSTRNQLIGEAKFIRAFCYFYLTNLFGDIPLVLTPDFNQTVLLPKAPQAEVYSQIVSDLVDGQELMVSDFSLSNGMPIRANKWAATALLARVYQYLGQWKSADSAATAVINSGQFSLVPLPLLASNGYPPSDSDVFEANSQEAILQLQTVNISPYALQETQNFIPYCFQCGPNSYWMTAQLMGSFEPNDLRRADWVDSSTDGINMYYEPYKYKIQFQNSGPAVENYTLLRLAEQYLIKAEAEANLSQSAAAINDVNTIRIRAGLDSLSPSLANSQILDTIQHEYRIEFFAEWGHRWLDLKRWGTAILTLKAISYKAPNINLNQLLYPIPMSEIQTDPNLTQNTGY